MANNKMVVQKNMTKIKTATDTTELTANGSNSNQESIVVGAFPCPRC